MMQLYLPVEKNIQKTKEFNWKVCYNLDATWTASGPLQGTVTVSHVGQNLFQLVRVWELGHLRYLFSWNLSAKSKHHVFLGPLGGVSCLWLLNKGGPFLLHLPDIHLCLDSDSAEIQTPLGSWFLWRPVTSLGSSPGSLLAQDKACLGVMHRGRSQMPQWPVAKMLSLSSIPTLQASS